MNKEAASVSSTKASDYEISNNNTSDDVQDRRHVQQEKRT